MKELQEFNPIEAQIHLVLDKLSNNEPVDIQDEWIDQAGEHFKEAIRRKIKPMGDFRLRMSNLGRPLCQLQQEKLGTPKSRMPYNHFVRMLIGDAVEAIMELAVKASGLDITDNKNQVSLKVNESHILGESDLDIDNAVFDTKSCSPYAFQNKWSSNWDGVYTQDSFGYVEQLYGYATAQNKKMGGWIVVDKSSGEVKVVLAKPTNEQLKDIKQRISDAESKIDSEFKKCFEDEEETFYKKKTGNRLVPMTCTFCPYMKDSKCWPNAVFKPKALSKAAQPTYVYYSEYTEQ